MFGSKAAAPAANRAFSRAATVALLASAVLLSGVANAGAITRSESLNRANSWVKAKVPYSQSRYHKGYRQDCSGFVSMAWKLKTSVTTRSIGSKARRISKNQLLPGDAVLTPGHVVLFAGWKNKKAGTFYAYEEPSSGKRARKSVKTFSHRSKALRYKKMKADPPKAAPAPVPAPAPAPVLQAPDQVSSRTVDEIEAMRLAALLTDVDPAADPSALGATVQGGFTAGVAPLS